MIALVRAEDVRLIGDGADGWISVPDLKIPDGIEWGAYAVPGQPAFHFRFTTPWGEEVWSTWHGPHSIGGQKVFFVDIPDDTDKRILLKLREWLGEANCAPLIRVLRLQTAKGQAVRNYVKAQPWFNPIRNSIGQVIGIHAPLVIAGRSSVDLDGEDAEEAQELLDLEA